LLTSRDSPSAVFVHTSLSPQAAGQDIQLIMLPCRAVIQCIVPVLRGRVAKAPFSLNPRWLATMQPSSQQPAKQQPMQPMKKRGSDRFELKEASTSVSDTLRTLGMRASLLFRELSTDCDVLCDVRCLQPQVCLVKGPPKSCQFHSCLCFPFSERRLLRNYRGSAGLQLERRCERGNLERFLAGLCEKDHEKRGLWGEGGLAVQVVGIQRVQLDANYAAATHCGPRRRDCCGQRRCIDGYHGEEEPTGRNCKHPSQDSSQVNAFLAVPVAACRSQSKEGWRFACE
jgi:hypothetical protein